MSERKEHPKYPLQLTFVILTDRQSWAKGQTIDECLKLIKGYGGWDKEYHIVAVGGDPELVTCDPVDGHVIAQLGHRGRLVLKYLKKKR